MMDSGVLAGANMAVIEIASYPGTVAAIVGKPGNNAEGCALVTARAFNLPDFTCCATAAAPANLNCTWPPTKSLMPWPTDLYGMLMILTPAIDLNSSTAR